MAADPRIKSPPRQTLGSVENVISSRSAMHAEAEDIHPARKGSMDSQGSQPSGSSSRHSMSFIKESQSGESDEFGMMPSSSSAQSSTWTSPNTRTTSHSSASSVHVPAINLPRSQSSKLSASLLTPTLASALGIIPSARRKRRTEKQAAPPAAPSSSSTAVSSSSQPTWVRRPSLPSLSSGNSRMSMFSVRSFDSLPEGETATVFASSPLSPRRNVHHDEKGAETSSSTPEVTKDAVPTCAVDLHHAARQLLNKAEPSSSPQKNHDAQWAKRKNVAMELLDTERAYVATLRIVHDHYFQPLITSSRGIAAPHSQTRMAIQTVPSISRKAVSEIFSNFADIMHLNTELLARLEDRLSGRSREAPHSRPLSMVLPGAVEFPSQTAKTEAALQPWDPRSDKVGDLLAPIAPFLKMYSFYVKNFSGALTRIEAERKVNEPFARFLKETEKMTWMTSTGDRSTGFGFGLGLQAHLLAIVQRIPRYKLLVGELLKCTPSSHSDYADLCRAFRVIEHVAESINDDIRQHEMVLSMLNIQRTLIGLTFPLIVPGRALLKRATMLKAGRKDIHAREFFLFSDCIVYAAPVGGTLPDASSAWQVFSRYGGAAEHSGSSSPGSASSAEKTQVRPVRPSLGARRRTISVPTLLDPKRLSFSQGESQQLQFRGKFALQDCTVVGVEDAVCADPSLRHSFEIRTPGKSFAVYADSIERKQEWLDAIRTARDELMTNRRTLQADEDSILARREKRRSLQGIGRQVSFPRAGIDMSQPSIPEDFDPNVSQQAVRSRRESLPSFSTAANLAAYFSGSSTSQGLSSSVSGKSAATENMKVLEDYNAPVWVPDSRADKCACCSESFGLWRRKHHCRLCGQVVCWSCSQRSFLIAGCEEGEQDKPSRACDTCYESVFPESDEAQDAPLAAEDVNHDGVHEASGLNTRARNSRALDSDTSVPSCPATPTTPPSTYVTEIDEAEPSPEKPKPRTARTDAFRGAVDFHIGENAQAIAPATRIAKASVLEAQVHHGRLLSPQVHAATSGAGTFRLVTPRLATPESEKPPLLRLSQSFDNRDHDGDSQGAKPLQSAPIPGHFIGSGGGDYFSARGAATSASGQSRMMSGEQPPSYVVAARRRKPLGAAARLSSMYGVLPSSSSNGSNLSSSSLGQVAKTERM